MDDVPNHSSVFLRHDGHQEVLLHVVDDDIDAAADSGLYTDPAIDRDTSFVSKKVNCQSLLVAVAVQKWLAGLLLDWSLVQSRFLL